ncbi:hypothetical protein V6C27_13850 [Peptococcaceae bacterium 1198_IL3148]
MDAILFIGLFASVLVTFYLLFVPTSEYDTTPVGLTTEFLKTQLERFFNSGGNEKKLTIINKSIDDIIKYATFFGLGFGLLATILTVKFIGAFSIIVGFVATVAGVLTTRILIENEFKKWQAELFQGVPPLINFMPAFLDVGALTPSEALVYTVPFLPEPLKSEMQLVINRIKRTGETNQALNTLSRKAKHPIIDAVCFRLGMAWESKVEADMFLDLAESVDNENDQAATRATVTKSGLFALIAVLALVGAIPIFGYPAWGFVEDQITGGFGM